MNNRNLLRRKELVAKLSMNKAKMNLCWNTFSHFHSERLSFHPLGQLRQPVDETGCRILAENRGTMEIYSHKNEEQIILSQAHHLNLSKWLNSRRIASIFSARINLT